MKINPNKTVSANAAGITISYRESNKYQFLGYQNGPINQPKVKYQSLTKPVFNQVQQKLYAETIYGLNAFTSNEIKSMSPQRKSSIIKNYAKCQDVLNQWKQEIVNEKVDNLLKTLFPHSKLVKFLTGVGGHDQELTDRHTFKELGINQLQIATKLVTAGILPKDFFKLEYSIR